MKYFCDKVGTVRLLPVFTKLFQQGDNHEFTQAVHKNL